MIQAARRADPDVGRRLPHWLARLRPGEPQREAALCVVPLILAGPFGPAQRLAHEAIAGGTLTLREDGGGRVGRVVARNADGSSVLVLEGETLVGGRQNRVVVRSSVVPARAERPIEVRCIERDRWNRSSGPFSTGSMRTGFLLGTPQMSSQLATWERIELAFAAGGQRSETGDYHALLDGRSDRLRRRASMFVPQPGQVGIAVLHGGDVRAVEACDHPETWRHIAERTLPAYLLAADEDRSTRRVAGPDPRSATRQALEALRLCRCRTIESSGSVAALSVSGSGLGGGGLWRLDGPLHLWARIEPHPGSCGPPAV